MLTACIANCDAWLVKALSFDSVDEPDSTATVGAGAAASSETGNTDELCSGGNASAHAVACKPAKLTPVIKISRIKRHSRNFVIVSIFSQRDL